MRYTDCEENHEALPVKVVQRLVVPCGCTCGCIEMGRQQCLISIGVTNRGRRDWWVIDNDVGWEAKV